jgi:APA family basic amino acid/polyamine antiporter
MEHSHERVVHLEKKSLKRALGAAELFAIGYGDVGSSIYYALGATALYALGATPLALLIAGLVFVCTSLSYAEMASTFPEPGGSATFSRYAFNDLISFIAGWGLLLDYIVTIAISAFAIPPYINYIFTLFHLPNLEGTVAHLSATVIIIAFLFFLNFIGIKYSGYFSFILAILTIVSQLFVILFAAMLALNLPLVFSHIRIGVPGVDWSPDWWNFLKGTSIAMVAYTGIEAIAQLAAEAKHPAITVPRSIKWTMWTMIVLYFCISVIGLSVVSPQELGTTYLNNPIMGIVSNFPIGGQILAPWFGLIAAIILLIASNAGLIGCSRLMFSMGEYYQVPRIFYQLHAKFRTPHISLVTFAILACVVVLASRGQMIFFVDIYNFGAQIAFFFAHVSLLVLRWKKPELHRPFWAPLNIPIGNGRYISLTAVLGALATFSVWILVVITKPEGRNVGCIWMGLGIAMYLYYRKKKHLNSTGQLTIEKVKISEYHPMHLKHILVAARASENTEALQTAFQLATSFKAEVTIVHVMEIPFALPIHIPMPKRERLGEAALKRAEAIAGEYALKIHMKLIRARSTERALLHLIEHGEYDMVVLGVGKNEIKKQSDFVSQAKKFLKDAPCRVLFCKS